MNEQLRFYKELYSEQTGHKDGELNEFLNNDTPKLKDDEQLSCEGQATSTECLKALKSMENNKSPGSDGFSCELYKFFRKDTSQLIIDSFNFAFAHGELSIDQRRGLISLLPKKDKDRLLLKNWRPVTLPNTDYKILAKALASTC